ncbi:hypothetical protein D3C78_1315820 [compost metagenome]
MATEETDHHRLATFPCTRQHFFSHRWRWRFGDKRNDLGRVVGFEHVDRIEHHQSADLLAEIASACANQLRNPTAKFMNARAQFLAAGARRTHDANRTTAHRVAKAQRRAVDDGGAAVRSHHQQSFFMRQLLERQLVFQTDVIGKEHHVETVFQRLARFTGGKESIDGYHRQITVRAMRFGASQRGVARFV